MSIDVTKLRGGGGLSAKNWSDRLAVSFLVLGVAVSASLTQMSAAAADEQTPSSAPTSPTAVETSLPVGSTVTEPSMGEQAAPSSLSLVPAQGSESAPAASGPETGDYSSVPDVTSGQGEDSALADVGVSPLIVGQPDGAAPPYVYWTVKDASGNPVGGATFLIEGPRFLGFDDSVNSIWTRYGSTVTDCTGAPCTGWDLDPDPGEFLIKQLDSMDNTDGPAGVFIGSRYRLKWVSPPAGYTFKTPNTWNLVPADPNNALYFLTGPILGLWNANGTYNFGNFVVEKTGGSGPVDPGNPNQPTGPYRPSCAAGDIYGIRENGQMYRVTSTGTVTNVGSAAAKGTGDFTATQFNGLGIGYQGDPVYAYNVGVGSTTTKMKIEIYKFDTTTGKWASTGKIVDSGEVGLGAAYPYPSRIFNFVAGGVNINNGKYYFGGFLRTSLTPTIAASFLSQEFWLWEYDPISNSVTKKGSFPVDQVVTPNGDLAFDVYGNLIVVMSNLDTAGTRVYSVTAANLAAASGGVIPTAASTWVTSTTTGVNGVAFDGDGYGYLGSATTLERYNMPGWSGKTTVTAAGLGLATVPNRSTDLASCSSPPTFTLEKVLPGGRVKAADQFTLTASQSGYSIGSVTTAGSDVGVQGQRLGPIPVSRGSAISFSEAGANLGQYASTYRCYLDGDLYAAGVGAGTSGQVTIPSSGQAMKCQFYNTPLKASVTVHKDIRAADGTVSSGVGWTVGATASAASGSVTASPGVVTQVTGSDGDASWSLVFGSASAQAAVNVREVQKSGYRFVSGECVVAHVDGSTTKKTLTGVDATAVDGVVPGDSMTCTYVNELVLVGSLEIVKAFDASVPSGSGGSDFTGTYTCIASGVPVASGTWKVTGAGKATLTPGVASPAADALPVGAQCTATEDTPSGGLPVGVYTWGVPSVSGPVVIQAGSTASLTVTNKADKVPGSVSWRKVGAGTSYLLGGSEWALVGPAGFTALTSITDCVAVSAAACTGADKNPASGQFTVTGLPWGAYTLTETKAPAGYVLDGNAHSFMVGGGDPVVVAVTLPDISNAQRARPGLPLTGGHSSDAIMIGGFIVLLCAGAAAFTQRRRRA